MHTAAGQPRVTGVIKFTIGASLYKGISNRLSLGGGGESHPAVTRIA